MRAEAAALVSAVFSLDWLALNSAERKWRLYSEGLY